MNDIAPALNRVPLDSVQPHPRNARQGDIGALTTSLERFGQVRPIVVQASTGYILAGNHLWRAAQAMGWTEIGVVLIDVPDDLALAYLVADNRMADLGTYNDQLLADLLTEIATTGSLEGTGFDGDDLDVLLHDLGKDAMGAMGRGDPDAAPDVPAEPWVKPGDLFVLGNHRLLCGDSTVQADLDRLMDGAIADILWTDPPYGVAYQTKLSVEEAVARHRRTDGLEVTGDGLTPDGTRALVADALRIVPLKAGGSFYLACPDGATGLQFRLALEDADLALREVIVWVKDRFVMTRQDYHWRHESVLYGWRSGAAHYFIDDRTQDTVWEIPRPGRSESHPTMKPVGLVSRALRNSSKPGDTVLDLFVGSGTTLISSEMLGRRCYAMEIDPRYAQVTVERWQAFTGQDAVLVVPPE